MFLLISAQRVVLRWPLRKEIGAQLYLGHTHVLLFICTSGILYTKRMFYQCGCTGCKVIGNPGLWDPLDFPRAQPEACSNSGTYSCSGGAHIEPD